MSNKKEDGKKERRKACVKGPPANVRDCADLYLLEELRAGMLGGVVRFADARAKEGKVQFVVTGAEWWYRPLMSVARADGHHVDSQRHSVLGKDGMVDASGRVLTITASQPQPKIS